MTATATKKNADYPWQARCETAYSRMKKCPATGAVRRVAKLMSALHAAIDDALDVLPDSALAAWLDGKDGHVGEAEALEADLLGVRWTLSVSESLIVGAVPMSDAEARQERERMLADDAADEPDLVLVAPN